MSERGKLVEDGRRRGPRFGTDSWTVEPFNQEYELWTMAHGHGVLDRDDGFYWLLVTAKPSLQRCRSITKAEGVADIRERLDNGRDDEVVLGGIVAGDMIEIQIACLNLTIAGPRAPVHISTSPDLLTRLSERLRDLYFDDFGECESFERASAGGIYGGPSLLALLEGRTS